MKKSTYAPCDVPDPAAARTPPKRRATGPSAKSLDYDILAGKIVAYKKVRDDEKRIAEIKGDIASQLKQAIEVHGVVDDKQNKVIEVPGHKISLLRVETQVVDQGKALAVLKRLHLVDSCTKLVLDEDKLALAFQQGKITLAEMQEFTTLKTSTRLDVR